MWGTIHQCFKKLPRTLDIWPPQNLWHSSIEWDRGPPQHNRFFRGSRGARLTGLMQFGHISTPVNAFWPGFPIIVLRWDAIARGGSDSHKWTDWAILSACNTWQWLNRVIVWDKSWRFRIPISEIGFCVIGERLYKTHQRLQFVICYVYSSIVAVLSYRSRTYDKGGDRIYKPIRIYKNWSITSWCYTTYMRWSHCSISDSLASKGIYLFSSILEAGRWILLNYKSILVEHVYY